jgi:hypothetical protein
MSPGRDTGGPVAVCGVELPLSDRPYTLLRAASASRASGLRMAWGSEAVDVVARPSLASRSRRSLLSRCLSACLSDCRLRTASAIRSVISSSCVGPIWLRSTPSETSSSSTWRTRSSSTSSESSSDELSSERRLDWCSIARGGKMTRGGDVPGDCRLRDRLSSRLLRESRLPSRLLSRLLRSLGGSKALLLPPLGMPTSRRLRACTSASMRSSSSSRSSLRRSFGKTLSPGLYFARSACFSSSLFPRAGLART